VLLTPLVTDGALEGITRATVLEIARDLGLEAHERTLGRADFFAADEAFLTGTGISGVVPVRSLDGASIGSPPPGPITQKLRAAYEERLRSEGFPI
jgi:branched-chain amino acid aminotransferase